LIKTLREFKFEQNNNIASEGTLNTSMAVSVFPSFPGATSMSLIFHGFAEAMS
jgi:hypothetical protein